MYQNGTVAGATGATGGLALTGMAGNFMWLFLAAFALIALGSAILRTLPRRER